MPTGKLFSRSREQGKKLMAILMVFLMIPLSFGSPTRGQTSVVKDSQVGIASYYAHRFQGRRTANGEIFDMNQMTAAHLRLKFGTKVKVTRLDNGQSVIVRINDRGPYVDGRVIDLSLAAARKLDMLETGIVRVSIEAVK